MQRTKRAVSLLLSFMLVLSCFTCLASVTAFAAGGEDPAPAAFVYGDVDGDGVVRINDATALQRHLAEQEGFVLEKGTDAFKAADVNGEALTPDQFWAMVNRMDEDKYPNVRDIARQIRNMIASGVWSFTTKDLADRTGMTIKLADFYCKKLLYERIVTLRKKGRFNIFTFRLLKKAFNPLTMS